MIPQDSCEELANAGCESNGDGDAGSSFADDFGMSMMAASFHWLGIVE